MLQSLCSPGAGLAGLAFAMLTRPAPQSISPFYLEKALSEGGGRNVVNVMLVDFRGFDTMGEITVLGIVALTVYALLRRFRPARESIAIPAQQHLLQRRFPGDDGRRAPVHRARGPKTWSGARQWFPSCWRDLCCRSASSSQFTC